MNLLHVRHATSLLYYADMKILIDPVLSEKESYPAIPLTPNRRKNPLVDLRTDMDTLFDINLILATHIHNDHFDQKAIELLSKNIPILCQPSDISALSSYGFLHLNPIKESLTYGAITITRVQGKHGTGSIGKAMGNVSGYILEADHEPTVYLTGDTIYYDEIRENIRNYQPDVLIMNAGSPKFLYSDRIVMNIIDIENTIKVKPDCIFTIVHLDSFNHCIETRADIREYFTADRLDTLGVKSFYVPEDNEFIKISISGQR